MDATQEKYAAFVEVVGIYPHEMGAFLLGVLVALCLWRILAWRRPLSRPARPLCLAAVLGSGGHTTEMLSILHALPRDMYTPRVYFVSSGDALSLLKAREAEGGTLAPHPMQGLVLPRARKVRQSWLTTPFSVLGSLAYCLWHVGFAPWCLSRMPWADVLVMNGPATCVPVVAAIWVMRVLGAPTPRMLYIESYARVVSLSLSARILRHVVDRFVVQWPTADPSAPCCGVLI